MHDTVKAARLLFVAGLLLAALAGAWWLLGRQALTPEQGGVLHAEGAPAGALPAWSPPDAGARPAPPAAGDVPAEEPAPLVARASLVVRAPADVQFARQALVELRRPADGWSDVRGLATPSGGTWRELLPGRYELRVKGTAWDVVPSGIELQGGDESSAELRPRLLLSGRVQGARSGRPVTAFRVSPMRTGSDGKPQPLLPAEVSSPDGRFAIAGLEPQAGPPPETFHVVITVPGRRGFVESEPLAAPPGPEWTQLVVRVPEPAVVGQITVAGAPAQAEVRLVDGDLGPEALDVSRFGGITSAGPRVAAWVSDAERSGPDGRFELELPWMPEHRVRLVALAAGALPGMSAPFLLPSEGPPLEVSLELQPSGRIAGHVRVPARRDGGDFPAVYPVDVSATPVGAAAGGPARVAGIMPAFDVPGHPSQAGDTQVPFLVDHLAAGEHELRIHLRPADPTGVRSLGPRTLTARVLVQGGATQHVDLDYDAPASGPVLRGRVVFPAAPRVPQAGAIMAIPGTDSIDSDNWATIANDGTFEIPGLAPGRWLLVAFGGGVGEALLGAAEVDTARAASSEPILDLGRTGLQVLGPPGNMGRDVWITGTTSMPAFDRVLAAQSSHALDAEGRLTVHGLPPGRYEVRLPDLEGRATSVAITSGLTVADLR